MDHTPLPIMANTFQSVLDASTLDARGDPREFCQRQRLITPFRFGLAVLASLASKQVHSIADLQRDVNALWDREVRDKACYTQRAKATGADLLRTSLCDLMGTLSMSVLGCQPGDAWGACNRMIMQDGSAFAIHDALCHVVPGRFNAVTPAAVARHGPMDVLCEAPITLVLSPDTDAEHDSLPEPESLKGDGFLADRGSLALTY